MKLQGRNLGIDMQGEDVGLLHSELRQLGFVIPDHELQKAVFGVGTRDVIAKFQAANGLVASGEVDESTAQAINAQVDALQPTRYVVRGRVQKADDAPLAGVRVRAYDKDLRHEELLGQVLTDQDGQYEIHYTAAQFQRAEKGAADLRVAVLNAEGDEWMSSAVLFNALAEVQVNHTVPDAPDQRSEFERHVATIARLLEGQGENGSDLPLAALTADDIGFLASETGIERQYIAWLQTASAYSARTASIQLLNRLTAPAGQVPAALFYGWFRQGLPDQWDQLVQQPIRALRTAAKAAIGQAIIPAALEDSLEAALAAMPNRGRDELSTLATTAGLQASILDTVLRDASSVEEVDNMLVSQLVEAGSLSNSDAHRLGLALAVHGLVGGNPAAAAAIINAKPARRDGMALARARDLAALEPSDLERVLGSENVEPPTGMTLPAYAAQLAQEIADTFPNDALLYRSSSVSDEVAAAVERVIAGRGETPPDGAAPRSESDPLQALINLHPGLRLSVEVDKATDASGALRVIKERVGWMDQVHRQNPDLDLLEIDYLPESESLDRVNFEGLSDDARSMVVANLKAYQRVGVVAPDASTRLALLQAGYSSATALARDLPSEIAEKSGLEVPVAQAYQAQAEKRATETAITWFAFHDLVRDQALIRQLALPGPTEYLKKLAGYDQLFGSVNYCQCEKCRSVLSPAAYFVDLMFWIERHILGPSFRLHGGSGNSLHLYRRRQDLWTLPLTCANTNNVVPTLDLVNDMLEAFIVKEKGFASADQLYDRLTGVDYSIRLPFSYPLERLTVLLGHLKLSRDELAQTLLLPGQDEALRARVRLGMTLKQFQIVTSTRLGSFSVADIQGAERYFTLWLKANLTLSTIPGQTETRSIDFFGTPLLMSASGLERPVLGEVLATDFVNGAATGAPARIAFVSGISTAGGVQNDAEQAENFTAGRLDRFERFVRLWRHIPWSTAELDYVLGRLKPVPPSGVPGLSEPMLTALAQLLDLQDRTQLPVDELCALWDSLPAKTLRAEVSLFNRAFNTPVLLGQGGLWPDANQSIDSTAGVRARLVAALQISDAELSRLVNAFGACLDRANTAAPGNPINVQVSLSERNLNLLYRHARLARSLKLSAEELFQTIALTSSIISRPAAAERCITSLADLLAVLETHDWRVAGGFSLQEIAFITQPGTALAGYERPAALGAQIAAEVATEKSLQISADLFTQIGLAQAASTRVIEANTKGTAPLLEPIPGIDSYRIVGSIDVESVANRLAFAEEPPDEFVAEITREIFQIVKLAGDAGLLAGGPLLGLASAEAAALVYANTSSSVQDRKPFEPVPGLTGRFRLSQAISEADAFQRLNAGLKGLPAMKSLFRARAVELVLRHHAMTVLTTKASAAVRLSPDKTTGLLRLALPDDATQRQALVASLQGGPELTLVAVLARLVRYAVLFKYSVYDSQALEFVRAQGTVLKWAEPPTAETIRFVSTYAGLASTPDPAYQPEAQKVDVGALQAVLTWPATIASAATDAEWGQLASALSAEVPLVKGALPQLALAVANLSRLDELWHLKRALELTRRVGVPAKILKDALSDDTARLASAADGIYAAIRAKYTDDKVFHDKLEPFDDSLRSRRRDGLVEYLLNAPDDGAQTDWRRRFTDVNDLYHYFLTDVLVEGCARTSKVVAAISSVQLYVQRVLMNLEQSNEQPAPTVVARFDDPDRQREWAWRKNYQVWVANRKVFLYPENYLEPGLRDDKTPLFNELEDTLLQQQITEQNTLNASAQYLHGLAELSRLRVAGAYHDRPGQLAKSRPIQSRLARLEPPDDVLHLFGVTASEPPVFYYRTVRNLEKPSGPIYSAWQRLDLQIPVRKISPIVFQGQLYVFWVETTTRSLNDFKGGSSEFVGYRHSVRTKFSMLQLDGRWTPPQTLRIVEGADPHGLAVTADTRLVDDILWVTVQPMNIGKPSSSQVKTMLITDESYLIYKTPIASKNATGLAYEIVKEEPKWDALGRDHRQAIEGYSPQGREWMRIYPGLGGQASDLRLTFVPRSNGARSVSFEVVDFWNATLSPSTTPNGMTVYAAAALDPGLNPFNSPFSNLGAYWPLAEVINGNEKSLLVEAEGQLLYVQYVSETGGYHVRRFSTTMVQQIGGQLTGGGHIASMLALSFQRGLKEADAPAFFDSNTLPATPYMDNPFQHYFREVFLHAPYLIADYLNSQQKFADAQRWYHYLFDPTAVEAGVDDRQRPWRFREFREQAMASLRHALTNQEALAAYRQDPFNPHAIARLRPGAYQKSIFMKYIDNLLDWGDSLFSQFTMESVNEASLLYVMAAELLGPRPVQIGPCGETGESLTYGGIAPLLVEDKTDVLIEELETFTIARLEPAQIDQFIPSALPRPSTVSQAATAAGALDGPPGGDGNLGAAGPADPMGWNRIGAPVWKERAGTPVADVYSGGPIEGGPVEFTGGTALPKLPLGGDPVGPPEGGPPSGIGQDGSLFGPFGSPRGFDRDSYVAELSNRLGSATPGQPPAAGPVPPEPKPSELIRARIVFCIPANQELLGDWDRVEDRLDKIRNCADIAGVRRGLELFAPEIDPHMLVRLRAAGLTLDDVLNVASGSLPPYRFAYLIDKAKQYASLVQSFGTQLLSSLEKRDTEELTRLRTVHEQNLLNLRSQMTQWEIDAAEDTLESLQRQKAAAEYRRDHYTDLLKTGLTTPERFQQASTHAASTIHGTEAILALLGGAFHLIPDVGAPTSMKYGGSQTGQSMKSFAIATDALAQVAQAIATTAGIEAGFQRRDEDWRHQVTLAQKELDQIQKQITAAQFRRDIAAESLNVHHRSIDQIQEIFDFLRNRFTNLGLFTWLSAELQKLHRSAFAAALSMARLAEQACNFEHPDAAGLPALSGDYWDAGKAGLLAGDRLLLDLYNLECQYIETNHRPLEIEQSFSLARFNPNALSQLRTDCRCQFTMPEWFFDLTYPGQYRRRIKAVRLTIPCVVGPYANVGATLRLLDSSVRKEPRLESSSNVPLRHTTVIAASTGQSDAGVFEFSFRDEHYMPFEGAGVNSTWELSLPKSVKSFDYGTISDVILRVSYTAQSDSNLRDKVEGATGILSTLRQTGVVQVLSLRRDFPAAWQMLLGGASAVSIDIRDIHVPFFMSTDLQPTEFDFLVQKLPDDNPVYPTVRFHSMDATNAGSDTASGLYKLGSSDQVPFIGRHSIEITDLGTASIPGPAGGAPRLDSKKLNDIVLRVMLKRQ